MKDLLGSRSPAAPGGSFAARMVDTVAADFRAIGTIAEQSADLFDVALDLLFLRFQSVQSSIQHVGTQASSVLGHVIRL